MAEQRIMTIGLRGALEKGPRYKRAAYASKFVRSFVKKHMKAKDVRIETAVNDMLFKNGMKNPPSKIRVSCSKDDKNVVRVSIVKVTG
jgi:large subunit ribosomal protein L31e